MRDVENPGGMLCPDPFAALNSDQKSQEQSSQDWENSYDREPEYSPEGVAALGDLFGRRAVPDGGYFEEEYGSEKLADVDHTPPFWTGMDNPSL